MSDTEITATLPAHPGAFGQVPVEVRNPDGRASQQKDLFAYAAGHLAFPRLRRTIGPSPSAVVVSDFNGDRKPDLAVANYRGHKVSVLFNVSE